METTGGGELHLVGDGGISLILDTDYNQNEAFQ